MLDLVIPSDCWFKMRSERGSQTASISPVSVFSQGYLYACALGDMMWFDGTSRRPTSRPDPAVPVCNSDTDTGVQVLSQPPMSTRDALNSANSEPQEGASQTGVPLSPQLVGLVASASASSPSTHLCLSIILSAIPARTYTCSRIDENTSIDAGLGITYQGRRGGLWTPSPIRPDDDHRVWSRGRDKE